MIDEDELRAIVNRLPTALIAVDHQLTVAFANASAMRMFHPAAVRPGAQLPQNELGRTLEPFLRSLFEPEPPRTPHVLECAETTYTIAAIPFRGRRVAAVAIDDVGDRARLERSRNDFVANAAHELLTPLTGIASAAHVLESGAKEVPEMRDRFLHHIARECSRLTRIARGLLVLARAQSGQEPPSLDIVELRPLLDDVVEATADGSTMLDCPGDVRVFVDRDLVETALSNLVANAIRHSRDGKVSVVVEKDHGKTVDVLITNAGVGAHIERFHERFASGGGRDGGGFGLGMSIAREALAVVGGTLSFEFDGDKTHTIVELPAV